MFKNGTLKGRLKYGSTISNELREDLLDGGLADGRDPFDFPADVLREGIKVEMEHTDSQQIAAEIAMDHLTEDIDYYKKLKKIEKM